MCGIFGYIGKGDPLSACITGLQQLEYRGYDSTGIAGIEKGKISFCKEVGKLSALKEKLTIKALELAIGHTRWATHGKVTNVNAHPHLDTQLSIALVHNGIIENYDTLRQELKKNGALFASETDSEVIAQLVASQYQGDLLDAVHKSLPHLKGHFAIALIHKDHPDQIIAAARECPLSVAISESGDESLISSDPNAFFGASFNVLFLKNNEIAKVQKGKIEVFDQLRKLVMKSTERLDGVLKPASKDGFEHFMLKEIFEQPTTVKKALLGRFENQKVQFESIGFSTDELKNVSRICFIGCGTSSHAGQIGALLVEDLSHIPASFEIASEARYRIFSKETLVVAISQSGETADTIAAMREIKSQGHKVLGICNVKNSTLTRESDGTLFLKAGPEMSVCSTKAFTSQITLLTLLAQYLAELKGFDTPQIAGELMKIPEHIEKVLKQANYIEELGAKYSSYKNFFFMGRHYMFPTALEAALKLKEISYLNANGYPAGELKHGPIALIDSEFPVIAFCANKRTQEKIISNLQEVKARGAPILAFVPDHLKIVESIADDCIWLPSTIDPLSPFPSTIAGQLFAYYVAKSLPGRDIDYPRNLAKSVTVE